MSDVAGFWIAKVCARRFFEQSKEFSASAHRGYMDGFDATFEIARDRFVGAHAQDRIGISRSFTHYQREVGDLVAFVEHERFDLFGNRSNLGLPVAALEELYVAQVVNLRFRFDWLPQVGNLRFIEQSLTQRGQISLHLCGLVINLSSESSTGFEMFNS